MKTATLIAAALLAALPMSATAQGPQTMKNPPKITITTKLKEEPSKRNPKLIVRTVSGSGEAAYPDGAALQFGVRLREDQNFILRAQGFVTGGKWEIELPGLGDDVYRGVYVAQVDFDPELQPPGILPKMPADKRGLNHVNAELKLGTDEEIRKDTEEVLAWYKQTQGKLRGIVDPLRTAFAAQKTAKDAAAWKKASDEARDKLFEMDRELTMFRKRRRNVLRPDIFSALSNVVLTLKDFGLDSYGSVVDGGASGVPTMDPAQVDKAIDENLGAVDKGIAGGNTPPDPPKKEDPK